MKLNGRWFPQIVDGTVGIYIQYIKSDYLVPIFDPNRGGGGGGLFKTILSHFISRV